jgi:hypothetical protein
MLVGIHAVISDCLRAQVFLRLYCDFETVLLKEKSSTTRHFIFAYHESSSRNYQIKLSKINLGL